MTAQGAPHETGSLALLREELVRQRLAGSGQAHAPVLPSADRDSALPLSSGQRQMWLVSQIEPDSPDYLVPLVLRLRGRLDIASLRQAFRGLAARHEILRTRYGLRHGEPVQIIEHPDAIDLTVREVPPSADQEEIAMKLAERETLTPFDLNKDMPVRATALRLAADDHFLVLVIHHIACDEVSLHVLLDELARLYNAFLAGQPDPLSPMPAQYADYAAWEQHRRSAGLLDRDIGYWRAKLERLVPVELPTDRPRPAIRAWAGASAQFEVDARTTGRIREIGRGHKATPFAVFLAAFQALLARYAGKTHISVGTVASLRTLPELERMPGYLINTLILAGHCAPSTSFDDLVQQARDDFLAALEHRHAPFTQLKEEAGATPDLSRTPLFQVAFTMHEAEPASAEFSGLRAELTGLPWRVAKFDLALQLRLSKEGVLQGQIEYATALFEPATAQRMTRHYARLLEQFAADPSARIGDADILLDEELPVVLPEPHQVAAELPEATIPELFEARAARSPDAVALSDGPARLSYRDLDRRANQLARYLVGLGLGPGQIAALALRPSAQTIVAVLAVLKTGAAYLPIDPDDPSERIAFMLADARPECVLTVAAVLAGLPAGDGMPRIVLDDSDIACAVGALPDTIVTCEERRAPLRPANSAYVIYTSGSTGRPKAVCVTHGNVAALLAGARALFRFTESDVWSLFHSYAFDVSVWEMWGALLHGGQLVVVPKIVTRSPGEFVDLLVRHQVTVLTQTPSAFRNLLTATAGHPRLDHLRLRAVVFCGEKLEPRGLTPWTERFGLKLPELVNMYGITETTVHSTYHLIGESDLASRLSLVGTALPGQRVRLLDGRGNLVPVGVPGEMHVSGPGVAQGYLGRPALTAERFVPDPLGPPGSRMYRSGDLARWRGDGTLEFLGRIDHQVKIRGFRIEPGEIESVLTACPGVRDAAVLAREDRPGDRRLVAYVVPDSDTPPEAGTLRDHAASALPAHMIPAAFVILDSFPLTPNGKLNRTALPPPGHPTPRATPGRAPRTQREELLCGLFADVLGLPEVGIDDNFFDLGGDSLHAVALAGAVKAAGLDVSVRDIFQLRTVTELAARSGIARPEHRAGPYELLDAADRAALPAGIVDAYPLSQVQAGMLVEMLADTRLSLYRNVTSFRIRDTTPFLVAAFQEAVKVLLSRHEVLRTSIDLMSYSVPLQLVHAEAELLPSVHDLRGRGEHARKQALRDFGTRERARPMDLARTPLLRLAVHVTSEDEWWLSITECHAILEGWSFHSMLMELLRCYQDIAAGGQPQPPRPAGCRYADFIAAELRSLAGDEDRSYWRKTIAGHPRLALPGSWSSPPGAANEPVEVRVAFSDLEESLRGLAVSTRTSMKSVLVAAHVKVMSMLSAGESFFTGLVCDARPELPGVDGVLGMYLNTVPFAVDGIPGTWRELVEQAFAREVELWPHRQFPMPTMQREFGGGERLIEVMFVYLDFRQVDDALVDYEASIDDSPNEFGLSVVTLGGTLLLRTQTRVMRREYAELLAEIYRSVLAAMAASADGDARAACLPAATRHRVLTEWQGVRSRPVTTTIPALFQAQVARTPDAVALTCADRELTYSRLNMLANRLARLLIRRGAGPETLIGLAMPRSPEMVVALLAVLKAGAAYLPIDPSYPAERVAYMLRDARPAAVITTITSTDAVPAGEGAAQEEVVVLGTAATLAELAGLDDSDLADQDRLTPLLPGHPAYVIYTSGSSGAPKGVTVTHQGVVNLLEWAREAIGGALSEVLASTSLSFDVAVFEILAPLVMGGRIEVVSDLTALAGQSWSGTLLSGVPSVFAGLASGGRTGAVLDQEKGMVVLCGEAVPGPLPAQLRSMFPGCQVANVYGPTETTVYVVACLAVKADGQPPPIGQPIANTRAYVLDGLLELVPPGVAGELYIGGAQVARGYLGRPALTAERFLPDPFGPPGSRMYRSGDLARWRGDGALEFLGRIDHQVKIRGFRIEPGEIESVLAACPGVRDAVVLAREDRPGDRRLVAYVVPDAGARPPAAQLRDHAARALPAHMIPAAFVILASFPLTPNGKLDRAALPPPGYQPAQATPGRAPRTQREELLCGLFADTLGVPRVTIDDNFFDLGGDSLLAIALIGRIRSALDAEVGIVSVFEAPTVAGLAGKTEEAGEPRPRLTPVPRPGLLPLSYAQSRLWFLHRLDGPSPTYNIPSAVRLSGGLDRRALRTAFQDVVARHEALRTVYPDVGGKPFQRVLDGDAAIPDFLVVQTSQAELDAQLAVAARHAFDLSRELPVRAWLFAVAPDEHVLFILIHHIAADGWSTVPLTKDLLTAYRARQAGREPGWPALPVQYADYVLWQRELLGGDSDPHSLVSRQLRYWRAALAGLPEELSLPADRSRPAVPSHRGGQVQLLLDARVHAGLESLARGSRTTLFMVVQAGLAVLLTKLGAGTDIPIGCPVAGRADEALDDLVGFFVNTLVLRTDTSGDPSFPELMARIRSTDLGAFAHQDLPLERLVQALNPARSPARHPLFQVMLTLHSPYRDNRLAGDLGAEPIPLEPSTARFDLHFALRERYSPGGAPDGLDGVITYSTDLFDLATAARIASQLACVLDAFIASPGQPVGQIHHDAP
jgi:amino acid adenylation domain-containing protein